MARSCMLLCALARACVGFSPVPASRAAVRLSASAEAAESVEFELSGNVRTAFFANVCRRELLFNRGMAGTMREGSDTSVVIVAEGPRNKLDSFVRWCTRPTLTLENDTRRISNVAYGPAVGLSDFSVAKVLKEGPPIVVEEVAAEPDEPTENELIREMIFELGGIVRENSFPVMEEPTYDVVVD
ncbi:hypothetical protein M885DRAFT_610787 [Pelagophyceae sp. CCMP2097]|nr:hypothetical protein M885DRAFT_610787 [Pelagophyceae sp. CCMP2097]|mmetsp:Transcript_6930/g.22480  ORF Transcript_6930/g.22480 Transcript_6930/m.22480 type:complete len:185 (-) Transcript_6930:25-579(-)